MRNLLLPLAALSLAAALPAQEKASARDMYFGGFDGVPAPKAASVRKPGADQRPWSPPIKKAPAPVAPPSRGLSTTPTGIPVIHAANTRTALGLRYAILKMNGIDAVEVPASPAPMSPRLILSWAPID